MTLDRIHLVGIGGIGLSAIARVLIARGVLVSGSDQIASPLTDELAQLGAKIFIGHRAENIGDVDLVLVTSAAPDDNPEIIAARARGIRVARRNDFFPELTEGKTTIAIAGTHGKTTTTGMIAVILAEAGYDPDAIIGGVIPEFNGNARAGNGRYFVIEADEYDRAFLGLRPTISVVTNIEFDHPDKFHDLEDVTRAFREFIARAPVYGLVVGCGDAERVAQELPNARARTLRYGFDVENDWSASALRPNAEGGNDFTVWQRGERIGDFRLKIPGKHNVLNALAAIAVAHDVGVDLNAVRQTLRHFRGAARRFEVKPAVRGVTLVDDYAHHPTEIRATLSAARERFRGRAIWAVFQPHTYSRTHALLDEFANAFERADHVIITEIFAARERESLGITGAQIVARMKHRDARFIANLDECAALLESHLRAGDVLITLGAGDVNRVGAQIAMRLGESR
ncbi:MAG: UDP-N-acetylmuramate--L-alanine ligase [Chloroflexi bacterium]|nr:UDP-N-acetylmuramate--L-alanine ligase [Chloroflexota bacterium]